LRRAYARSQASFDIMDWAAGLRALSDLDVHFAVTDRKGIVVAGTLKTKPGERMDLSARAPFQFERDSPGDDMFIATPVIGAVSGKRVLIVARKTLAPAGTFGGIVLAALDLAYLARFYQSVDLGKQGIVRLVGLDGIVLIRAGGDRAVSWAAAGKADSTSHLMAEYARAPVGEFTAPSQTDGVRRIFAYRKTRGFPLIVQVGITEAEALARYRDDARAQGLLGGALTALILALLIMHLKRDRQLRAARDLAQAAYAYKSRLLHSTIDHISQGILVVGADNCVQLCNRRLLAMLEVPEALAARDRPLADMLRYLWDHDEFEDGGSDFALWFRGFMASVRGPAALRGYEHTRPNGLILDVRSTLLPNGSFVRSYTDTTDLRLDAQLLRAAREGADLATRAKSAFLATMSHEIRSPLSGLLGVLDLLRATKLDPEQSRMATMIHGSGRMLLAVLNDILDFSKMEAGALSVAREAADLRALLDDVVLPHVEPARQRGVAVSLAVADGVPAHVLTDPLRTRQIIGNLVSNAMKFTEAGSVHIDVAVQSGGSSLIVRVRDTGIGMDAGTVSRLFKPFSQADGSITRKFGGTGLGLCISQQLAGLLGGALTVTSRPGAGSEFCLTLPCVACAAPAREAAGSETPANARRATEGRALRALLADDDPTNRWLGQNQLQTLGFAVDLAEDGQVALEKLRAAPFDLLVTDLHMPRLSGIDLTEAVRRDPHRPDWRDLPIVGLTADTTEEQRTRCRQAGMTELAIKPVTGSSLAALLARVFPETGRDGEGPPLAAPALGSGADPGLGNQAHGLLAVPFDSQIAREIFPPGDEDGAAWLRDYLAAAARDVAELGQMLDAPQAAASEIARRAHRLAGSSFSVGAMLLGGAARVLERAALDHAGSGAQASGGVAPLRWHLDVVWREFAAADAAIDAFLAPAAPAAASSPAPVATHSPSA
jgi:signal transduction histidine kinase/DNA-binding response OmpR family regulator